MLLEIAIENLALVDQVRLPFGGGLNVLSGETGAGKSIILDALQVALGGRASTDLVRTGADVATIEAVFAVPDPVQAARLADLGLAVDDDGTLVVRREIHKSGRGRILVCGRAATAAMLREATDGLADLHGQHEHHSLLQPDKHLDLLDQYGGTLLARADRRVELLDAYAGGRIPDLRQEMAAAYQALHAVAQELASLGGDARDRARQVDLLRFQVEELEAARLEPGEEAALAAELRVLANAERLQRAAAEGYALLYEGGRTPAAHDLMAQATAALRDAAQHDPSLAPVLELLAAAAANLAEAAHFLADYGERVEVNPGRMAAVESRLAQIAALGRKYGDGVAEMLAYLDRIRAELERLESAEGRLATLEAERQERVAAAAAVAARLTAARRAAAAELGRRVAAELADLGMAGARFEVEVAAPPAAEAAGAAAGVTAGAAAVPGPRGWDRVEFLFSPNVGEPPRPLARIVSGGEMSRIMLALKTILARVDAVPTLVFDEVDQGISGRTAQAVAEKLAAIARDRQVLCVTHLPQVAAMADTHFRIHKEVVGGRTVTRVETLDAAGRTEEIARMIGGAELTELTLAHAREMLAAAQRRKPA